MGEMNYNSPQLVEAVRIWTGWGTNLSPSRDDGRIVEQYGEAAAAKLLPIIKALEDVITKRGLGALPSERRGGLLDWLALPRLFQRNS